MSPTSLSEDEIVDLFLMMASFLAAAMAVSYIYFLLPSTGD